MVIRRKGCSEIFLGWHLKHDQLWSTEARWRCDWENWERIHTEHLKYSVPFLNRVGHVVALPGPQAAEKHHS